MSPFRLRRPPHVRARSAGSPATTDRSIVLRTFAPRTLDFKPVEGGPSDVSNTRRSRQCINIIYVIVGNTVNIIYVIVGNTVNIIYIIVGNNTVNIIYVIVGNTGNTVNIIYIIVGNTVNIIYVIVE